MHLRQVIIARFCFWSTRRNIILSAAYNVDPPLFGGAVCGQPSRTDHPVRRDPVFAVRLASPLTLPSCQIVPSRAERSSAAVASLATRNSSSRLPGAVTPLVNPADRCCGRTINAAPHHLVPRWRSSDHGCRSRCCRHLVIFLNLSRNCTHLALLPEPENCSSCEPPFRPWQAPVIVRLSVPVKRVRPAKSYRGQKSLFAFLPLLHFSLSAQVAICWRGLFHRCCRT